MAGEVDIITAILANGIAVSALARSVSAWLSARKNRHVSVTVGDKSLDITNLDDPEQATKLIEEFLAQHSAQSEEAEND